MSLLSEEGPYSLPGKLHKKTPTIITSNFFPEHLFRERRGEILRGLFMIVNCKNVRLFNFLDIIRNVHGLTLYVQSSEQITIEL